MNHIVGKQPATPTVGVVRLGGEFWTSIWAHRGAHFPGVGKGASACTEMPAWRCLHGHVCTEMPARRCLHGDVCMEMLARRCLHGDVCTDMSASTCMHGGVCTGVPARRCLHGDVCMEMSALLFAMLWPAHICCKINQIAGKATSFPLHSSSMFFLCVLWFGFFEACNVLFIPSTSLPSRVWGPRSEYGIIVHDVVCAHCSHL